MGGKISDEDNEITDINVTPLVDVMLVLLIIFMVTASYIVNQGIKVSLPKAETGENIEKSKNIAFVIDAEEILYIDGKKTNFTEVATKISEIISEFEGKQKLQALISADQSVSHGKVINLIDVVRKSGITDFAINVESSMDISVDS